jgi:hypothetical protein
VLLDFQANARAGPRPEFEVRFDQNPAPEAAMPTLLAIAADGDGLVVESGAAQFTVRPGPGGPLAAVNVGGRPAIDTAASGFSVEAPDGQRCDVQFNTVKVEESGPLRASVLATGSVRVADKAVLDLDVRLHFFASSATVRFAVTVRNPRPATHRGGFWELGDPGSVLLRDLSYSVVLPQGIRIRDAWCSEEPGREKFTVTLPLELYQDSSGGDEWQHVNHRNREGVVPLRFQGYRLQWQGGERSGRRATPVVGLSSAEGSLAVTCRRFWQNFPKAIEATDRGITVRLFPRQFGGMHELQGGEQKTHHFEVAFATDRTSDLPLDWCRSPLYASLPPSWYCYAEAMPHLTPRAEQENSDHEALIDVAIDPHDGFKARRERVDEYGWRSFGDLFADHETVFDPDQVRVSHYNNQYDAVAGFARQFMRTGDPRWWELMDDLARHVADIDVYHTDGDKAAYNRGLFWHTAHYVDAGLSTHRSYPRAPRVFGGGMSNEHNYTLGLLVHHFLTGDPVSAGAAAGLAGWVVGMDDGHRTVFRFLSRSATGLASQTASPDYHGPGRGAGHSVQALLAGHQLTGDDRLLLKAEALIQRVVHPADDVAARNLLDAERRWSYTAFLQALGAYLHHKSERGERDAMYAYGRASLLQYARWMVEHEYPYLDKPDRLEFPTETWAAQDLRKSDVFYLAAAETSGDERVRFVERGAYFYRASIDRLKSMPTHRLTRPVVLLLSNGWLHHRWEHGKFPSALQPPIPLTPPPPVVFVPQKAIAKRRAIILAVASIMTAAVAGLLSAFG